MDMFEILGVVAATLILCKCIEIILGPIFAHFERKAAEELADERYKHYQALCPPGHR